MSNQDHKHFNSVNEFLDYLNYNTKPVEKTIIDKEFVSLPPKIANFEETDKTNMIYVDKLNQSPDFDELNQSTETDNLVYPSKFNRLIQSSDFNKTDGLDVDDTINTLDESVNFNGTNVLNENDKKIFHNMIYVIDQLTSKIDKNNLDYLESENTQLNNPMIDKMNKYKTEYTTKFLDENKDENLDETVCNLNVNKEEENEVKYSNDYEEYIKDDYDYPDSKVNKEYISDEHNTIDELNQTNFNQYLNKDYEYESPSKKLKTSHEIQSDENQSIDSDKTEETITEEFQPINIDDPETELFIDNLYDFLYKYGHVNNRNKKYINPKFLKNETEFVDEITINNNRFILDINSYKSCYVVRTVKRKILYDFSARKYLLFNNLLFVIMILENIFFNSITRSMLLLFSLIVFMFMHLFVNSYKNCKPETFWNKFYEFNAFYTDYNSNLLLIDFINDYSDTKIELDLIGEYRIICDKSFIIEGYYLSEDNKKNKISLLLNKPNKYGGMHSVIEESSINLDKIVVNNMNINNLDILLSLNTKNTLDNAIITNSLVSSSNNSLQGYKTYSFDLTTTEYINLPMFFKLFSNNMC